jgi:predicted molibdopterin-dependent oxidoreductase YjgC
MASENTLVINGNELEIEPGETLLETARRNDIDIPTLCHLKGAMPTGVCRVCVVEVEGESQLIASCATPAVAGMVVHTESPPVVEARKMIIRLLLSSGNHNCAIRGHAGSDWTGFQLDVMDADGSDELCPVWGDCRLQDLAYRYQVRSDPELETPVPYPMETVNPFIVRDFSRCILCGRCVQACNDVQVNEAIFFGYKSAATKIVTGPEDEPLKNSNCVFCGECVDVCPVGALVEKEARYAVRHWACDQVRTTCTYCGVGCQLWLHVQDGKVVKVTGVEEAAPNYGSLCVKGRFGFDFVHAPERLKTPLIKENGAFREASWDEALDRVAGRFQKILEDHGGDAMGVLSSARMTNEENYIAQKFARAVLKTNNVDHCARL